jgi:8-amino-7-oxononanoate synthase
MTEREEALAFERRLRAEIDERAELGLQRTLTPVISQGIRAFLPGQERPLVNLSSNDYLGLADHPVMRSAAAEGALQGGAGASASRLVTGHSPQIAALEEALASFKGTEAALVLGSGYLANTGVIASLFGRDDLILSDRLNHASIIDGIRLSGAKNLRYRHNDLDHLEQLLVAEARRVVRHRVIITETIFSMDGDVAPLREIQALAARYGALLMVDDAHGAGVVGPSGRGYPHAVGVAEQIDIYIGTFGKAFGSYGAYVAGSRLLIGYLVNYCRSLVFSTALPPAVIASCAAALTLIPTMDAERENLQARANEVRALIRSLGWSHGDSTTQIVPLMLGSSEAAQSVAATLRQHGILGVAIRPPTVPRNSARIRFALTAAFGDAELAVLRHGLEQVRVAESDA